mmetsp:Transcript_26087/g.50668  ORF Transcript_26087/g.50668 Transcript_26087/m.50668 type:complete len:386 (-) Transcript_26087:334-1491(-)
MANARRQQKLKALIIFLKFGNVIAWNSSASTSSLLHISPLNHVAGLGAEVLIPSHLVAHNLPEVERKALWNALEEHQVLLFPELGARLSMQDHVEFARQFGIIDPWVSRPPPYIEAQVHVSADTEQMKTAAPTTTPADTQPPATIPTTPAATAQPVKAAPVAMSTNTPCPVREAGRRDGCTAGLQQTVIAARAAQLAANEPSEVFKIVVAADDKLAFGEGFHTDLTYLPNPPVAAVLAGRQLPPRGLGDTLFMSAFGLFESLPNATRAQIAKLRAVHTDKAGRQATHPMTTDLSGRTGLNVNRHFTRHVHEDDVAAMEGGRESAETLMRSLFEHIVEYGAAHSLRVHWTPDLVVMWDERTTQHAGVHDYAGHRREMHRVLISDRT